MFRPRVSVGVVAVVAATGALTALVMQSSGPHTSNTGLVLGGASSVEVVTPSPTPTLEPPDFATVTVGVYNTTSITGLAKSTASRLTEQGWQVIAIAGLTVPVTRSTVYYSPGYEDEAEWLIAHDPSLRLALPKPASVVAVGDLVVALASDAS